MSNHYFVVTQVKSNRLVYFTNDEHYQPPHEENLFYVSSFRGILPPEMTLRNCWRWRFDGSRFFDANDPKPNSTKQSLVEYNKQALRTLMVDKINLIRKKASSPLDIWYPVMQMQAEEAAAFSKAPDSRPSFPFLENISVAHGCTLGKSADYLLEKNSELREILLATQKWYDHFTVHINYAKSEQELTRIRRDIQENLGPSFTHLFAKKRPNTEPFGPDHKLDEQVLAHERTRLSVQMSERIRFLTVAHIRQRGFDERTGNILRPIAERYVSENGAISKDDEDVINEFARLLQKTPEESADIVIQASAAYHRFEMRCEVGRLQMEFNIRQARTEAELEKLSREIWAFKI